MMRVRNPGIPNFLSNGALFFSITYLVLALVMAIQRETSKDEPLNLQAELLHRSKSRISYSWKFGRLKSIEFAISKHADSGEEEEFAFKLRVTKSIDEKEDVLNLIALERILDDLGGGAAL